MKRLDIHSVAFTLLLAALVTLASFATDMGLPVLAQTAASLGATAGRAALTLSVFLAGFALGPLVFGPLSDHHGRRPLLLLGVAMFAVFGALGAFSASLEALLAWRFLMGAGAGGSQVLVLAMVRDLFEGTEARVRQSYVNLSAGIAPIIAPTVGVAVATMGGWRAIYAVLSLGGFVLLAIAALRLGESVVRRDDAVLTLRGTLERYARVLAHPVSLGYTLVVALNFGCLFAYVSGSSLVLIELFGVSRRAYGLLFACSSFGLMIGSFSNARLIRQGVSPHRIVVAGMTAIVSCALLQVALTWTGGLRVWTLVPLAVAGFIGHGVVRPNAAQGALEPMPEIAGVASAVLSATQMVVGAGASAVVAAMFDGRTALAMTLPMAACAVASALVYARIVRPAERRWLATRPSVRDPDPIVEAEPVS